VSPETKVAVQVDGRTLTLTNLSKVLYPQTGFTKAEVLDYYQQVASALLPHVADRPLTLKRYPEGVDGEAFFQKHVTQHRPDWIRTARVPSESSRGRGGPVTYLVVDDLPTLIWAANLAGLELHVPQWRMPQIRRPDLLVFDLDPGAPANIVDCCRVAEDLRPLLEAEGFAPLAKTSGGKGLQLYAPISGVTSEQASDQARAFAERLERAQPRRVVSRMTKVLRTGKVLIDWSQNNGSKTTVAPYSLRARQSPTVSTPVTWDEVAACRRPEALSFTAETVLDRVAKHGDLFAPLLRLRLSIIKTAGVRGPGCASPVTAFTARLVVGRCLVQDEVPVHDEVILCHSGGRHLVDRRRGGGLLGAPVADLAGDRGAPERAGDGQRDQGGQLVAPGELV
jgi:bifunctional non-homologous end joining protein LigD